MKIIIDSNIVISALIYDSVKRSIISFSKIDFYYPEDSINELCRHKNEIMKKSGLNEYSYELLLDYLLDRINILPEKDIVSHIPQAKKIMDKIDPKDTIFIACAQALNCPIWSDDNHFKRQDKVKILDQKNVLELISQNETPINLEDFEKWLK